MLTYWLIQFIFNWVFPDWRITGNSLNNSVLKKIGYYTWTNVPKVLSTSSMKYSCPIFLMFAWILDTEISSPILTSQEAFLPIYKLVLFSVFRMKKTLDFVNSSLWLPELNVSRMMKLSLGLSTSIMSTILLLTFTENGKFTRHSSQQIFLYLTTTWPLTAFIVLFRSSQVLRHFKWMPPTVPVQLQGLIMGLNFSSSWSSYSLWWSKQILQTRADLAVSSEACDWTSSLCLG